jgi:hypothetical protein
MEGDFPLSNNPVTLQVCGELFRNFAALMRVTTLLEFDFHAFAMGYAHPPLSSDQNRLGAIPMRMKVEPGINESGR